MKMSEKETITEETEQVESLVEIATAELRVMIDVLKIELVDKEKRIEDLEGALAVAKGHIEADTKAQLISDLKKMTNYGDEYLHALSVERLNQLKEDYKFVRLPKFASSGDLGSKTDPHAKLHNMFKFGRKS